jgi:hypothetical protein
MLDLVVPETNRRARIALASAGFWRCCWRWSSWRAGEPMTDPKKPALWRRFIAAVIRFLLPRDIDKRLGGG